MIDIFAIRHAESTWNRDGRLVWHTNVWLSEAWILQRNALCSYLESLRLEIDHIISSDLIRTKETIHSYVERNKLTISEDKRLREMFFWEYENRLFSEIDMDPFHRDKYRYVAPGGESYETMTPRIREFLQERVLSEQWKTILLSTHACVIRVMDGLLVGTSPKQLVELEVWNASISHYRVLENIVERIRFWCDNHIKKEAA